ncbi:hypothetical protein ACFPIK_00790 [Algoriphagus aquatilis]|uniref:Glycosyltransferase RgtA/B/C/D-like domain-containing protein n=1 Tax=Algoriphagus aquatilis TaxID=490186 RepID=A0ABW0BR77_9BACT
MSKTKFLLFWNTWGAISIAMITWLPWRFQVNDDVIMMWLVSGAYTGTPEPFAVFIHPVLSWMFSKLYTAGPSIYWYESLWFLTIYFSFALLIKSVSQIHTSELFRNLLAFFILLISLHLSIFPQFTLVAGFAAFSSLVILTGKESKLLWRLAFVLLSLGIMIRWESTVLIGLGFIFCSIFTFPFSFRIRISKPIIRIVLLFISLIGSKSIYEINSPYAEFLKFNRIRAAVIDHPVFYQEILEKKIPESSELYFFSRWYFEDSGISETDLQEKKKSLDLSFFTFDYALNSLKRLWRFQKVEAYKSALILGILFFYFLLIRKKHSLILFGSFWLLFLLIFNHFFLIQGRVIFLFFLCFLVPLFKLGQIDIHRNASIGLFLFFMITFGIHLSNFLKEGRGRKVMDSELVSLQSRLNPSVPVLIEGYHEHNLGFRFSSLNPVPFLSTGWISRSEFQKKALKRLNLSSFANIQEYALITPTTNTEIVFPDYMDHAFGSFVQTDSVQTANFIFLQYKKR